MVHSLLSNSISPDTTCFERFCNCFKYCFKSIKKSCLQFPSKVRWCIYGQY